MPVASLAWAVALGLATSGCLYTRGSLDHGKAGYTNYPTTVAEEQARRRDRRNLARLGGPLEIIGGVGLTALALYAPVAHRDDGSESVTHALGDAGKELLGRLAVAAIGGAVAVSGVGDTVLGLTDPAFRSPLVRGGALVAADRIDLIAPARGPRLGFHAGQNLSTRGVGSDGGLGLAHWVGRTVRVREAAIAEWSLGFRSPERELRWALGGDVTVERAFGRRHAGLYPQRAVGLFGGGAWTRIDDRDRGVVRGGIAATVGSQQVRLGASYVPGLERAPAIELSIRRELAVD